MEAHHRSHQQPQLTLVVSILLLGSQVSEPAHGIGLGIQQSVARGCIDVKQVPELRRRRKALGSH